MTNNSRFWTESLIQLAVLANAKQAQEFQELSLADDYEIAMILTLCFGCVVHKSCSCYFFQSGALKFKLNNMTV